MRHHRAAAAALLLPLLAACSSSSTHPDAAGTTAPATPAAARPAGTPPAPATLTATTVTSTLEHAVPGLRTITTYTAASDPNHLLGRPGGYSSKTAFADPRVRAADVTGEDRDAIARGGSVEVFPTAAGAKARAAMGAKISESMPALAEYDFVHGRVLIRVSNLLTPTQAAAYKRVVNGL